MPAKSASAGTGSGSSGSSSPSSEASEPPASEPEGTPEAPVTTTPAKAPAKEEHAEKAKEGEKEESKESAGGTGSTAQAKLTDIKHVFVIVLSDEPYAADFGPESADRYLSRTLEGKGALLLRYDSVAHEQLPNGVALLSGQGPTAATAMNCPTYAPIAPASQGAQEQTLGEGCIYPSTVQTPALPARRQAPELARLRRGDG